VPEYWYPAALQASEQDEAVLLELEYINCGRTRLGLSTKHPTGVTPVGNSAIVVALLTNLACWLTMKEADASSK